MYNTPPAYGIYICGKVFKWLLKTGGLEARAKINRDKAQILYDYLDNNTMFKGTVEKGSRSLMNVTVLFIGDDALEARSLSKRLRLQAFAENLKGHRTVGGMRASIYNAMPADGVKALVAFMKKFEEENKGAM